MSADIIRLPSRARAHAPARENAQPLNGGEIYRFKRWRAGRDEWQSANGSSACILATLPTAEAADRFIADWRQGPDSGRGGAA